MRALREHVLFVNRGGAARAADEEPSGDEATGLNHKKLRKA